MNQTEEARLRAEVRALVAENADHLGIVPAAKLDLQHRLLTAGVLMVGDRLAMPDGGSPLSYVENVYRHDPDSAHLFAQPEPVTHVPAKPAVVTRAPADVSTPNSAAKSRADYQAALTARLARGNGHD